MDGFPSLCEDWLSMADQLDLVKNLPLTPDFIINIKVKIESNECTFNSKIYYLNRTPFNFSTFIFWL